MKKILCSLAVMIAAAVPAMQAITLDTGNPEKPFAFGVRVGANCSNLSGNYSVAFPEVTSYNSRWGAGLELGAVFELNIKKYLVLQPGFFFQTRSNDYQMVSIGVDEKKTSIENRDGGYTSTYFKIPIIMSFRLALSSDLEWQVDFGPYFQFGLGGSEKYDVYSISATENLALVPVSPENSSNVVTNYSVKFDNGRYKRDYFANSGFVRDYDWGFKMGTGLVVMKHYYIGVHYEAGCRNVLMPVEDSRKELDGRNKAWTFTAGYVF